MFGDLEGQPKGPPRPIEALPRLNSVTLLQIDMFRWNSYSCEIEKYSSDALLDFYFGTVS